MADISNIKVGTVSYSIKDTIARTTATNADTKSDQAISDAAKATSTASAAQTTANNAQTSATNANTKIDNAKVIGTYTETTDTLEISLEIGDI